MNRKQRVLTVIALVAFVLIGACHYLAWPPLDLWKTHSLVVTEWEELTWEEAKGKQIKGFNGAVFSDEDAQRLRNIWEAAAWKNKGTTPAEELEVGRRLFGPDFNDKPIPAPDDKAWLEVEYLHPYSVVSPSINWASTTRYRYGNTQTTAMIPSVGIPWFMLGVIYVGLFFLLADKKEVRP